MYEKGLFYPLYRTGISTESSIALVTRMLLVHINDQVLNKIIKIYESPDSFRKCFTRSCPNKILL